MAHKIEEEHKNRPLSFDEVFDPEKRIWAIKEVADKLEVSKNTLAKWFKVHRIRISRKGPGGYRTVKRYQIRRLFEKKFWKED